MRLNAKLPVITAVAGLVLFGDALAHVILALALPTQQYLAYSRGVTILLLGGGVLILGWLRRRNASQPNT